MAAPFVLTGWGRGSFGCDIGLQIGDSNSMQGTQPDGSPGYDPEIDVTNSRCLAFRNPFLIAGRNIVLLAKDPMQYSASAQTGNTLIGIGPSLTLMRDQWLPNYLEPTRNIQMVYECIPGTGFAAGATPYWATPPAPNAGGLNTAIARCNMAIAADPRNQLKFVLITGGANDAANSIAEEPMADALDAAAAYLRANLTGGSDVPILIEGLVPSWVAANPALRGPVQSAIESMPNRVSRCGYIDMTGCTGVIAIPFHLNADDQRLVGNRAISEAYKAAIS